METINDAIVLKINNNINYVKQVLKKQELSVFKDTHKKLKELTNKVNYKKNVCERINDLNSKIEDIKKRTEDICDEVKSTYNLG